MEIYSTQPSNCGYMALRRRISNRKIMRSDKRENQKDERREMMIDRVSLNLF
jgi:hypothetical protein